MLISTASRFEFDARFQHLAERLADGGQDQLWTGDCNVTYRFAQSEFAQFRAGLGINWLNDPTQTDLGFNFTYGADFFPAKPWVFSAVLDAGTLGHAGLFRFRTTAGVVYRSVELYSGYEYTDIGSVHWNGLIGGVRLVVLKSGREDFDRKIGEQKNREAERGRKKKITQAVYPLAFNFLSPFSFPNFFS